MATTDSNGILQLETLDNITPFQTTFNALSSSLSGALDKAVRPFIVKNNTERNALAVQRSPSMANPLLVWHEGDKGFQINTGSGWVGWPVPPEKVAVPGPNDLVIGGTTYKRSGTITSIPSSPAFSRFGGTTIYARTVKLSTPYEPPSGWYFKVWAATTSGYTIVTNSSRTTPTDGSFNVRHMQVGNNSISALTGIGWELVKS